MLGYFAQCASAGIALGAGMSLIKEELLKPHALRSFTALAYGLSAITGGTIKGTLCPRLKIITM